MNRIASGTNTREGNRLVRTCKSRPAGNKTTGNSTRGVARRPMIIELAALLTVFRSLFFGFDNDTNS